MENRSHSVPVALVIVSVILFILIAVFVWQRSGPILTITDHEYNSPVRLSPNPEDEMEWRVGDTETVWLNTNQRGAEVRIAKPGMGFGVLKRRTSDGDVTLTQPTGGCRTAGVVAIQISHITRIPSSVPNTDDTVTANIRVYIADDSNQTVQARIKLIEDDSIFLNIPGGSTDENFDNEDFQLRFRDLPIVTNLKVGGVYRVWATTEGTLNEDMDEYVDFTADAGPGIATAVVTQESVWLPKDSGVELTACAIGYPTRVALYGGDGKVLYGGDGKTPAEYQLRTFAALTQTPGEGGTNNMPPEFGVDSVTRIVGYKAGVDSEVGSAVRAVDPNGAHCLDYSIPSPFYSVFFDISDDDDDDDPDTDVDGDTDCTGTLTRGGQITLNVAELELNGMYTFDVEVDDRHGGSDSVMVMVTPRGPLITGWETEPASAHDSAFAVDVFISYPTADTVLYNRYRRVPPTGPLSMTKTHSNDYETVATVNSNAGTTRTRVAGRITETYTYHPFYQWEADDFEKDEFTWTGVTEERILKADATAVPPLLDPDPFPTAITASFPTTAFDDASLRGEKYQFQFSLKPHFPDEPGVTIQYTESREPVDPEPTPTPVPLVAELDNLVVSHVAANTARITVNIRNINFEQVMVRLRYQAAGDTEWTSEPNHASTTTTAYNLQGLTAATAYTVQVALEEFSDISDVDAAVTDGSVLQTTFTTS